MITLHWFQLQRYEEARSLQVMDFAKIQPKRQEQEEVEMVKDSAQNG